MKIDEERFSAIDRLTVRPDGVDTVTKSSPTVHDGDRGRAKRPRLSLALTSWAILSRSIRTSASRLVEHETQELRGRDAGLVGGYT